MPTDILKTANFKYVSAGKGIADNLKALESSGSSDSVYLTKSSSFSFFKSGTIGYSMYNFTVQIPWSDSNPINQ